ncbi:hypothetical protein A1O7_07466 [Cladophialophora yegresii CBS 114405]|uniref:Uncharacterized protein n=1 Tax=Cladophialophora yegresii CBS 114405 TaxID=1182544 RepID=W9VN31_9EURO|nr:uncharacterized protein A1O7_07466 [Cladophialophora yegresii CBS 114405]EXJ57122.1 hypothetical protein A1O7_07466 [Cladophialophora yegresii CBS 114405]
MPPKRRRQATVAAVPRGPNHQLNILRDHLDAQVKAEANLEATEDANLQDALEKDINNRNTVLANTIDDFLHDPFSRQPVSDFSNAEKYALRSLRNALVNELNQPCKANKTALMKANGSLVILLRPNATGKADMKQWVPPNYMSEDNSDNSTGSSESSESDSEGEDDSDDEEDGSDNGEDGEDGGEAGDSLSMVPNFSDTAALEWRPRHMRESLDQSVYEIDNPDIKHSDPIDQPTWDTLIENQPKPVEWRFESTDTETENKSVRKKKKKKKSRMEEKEGEKKGKKKKAEERKGKKKKKKSKKRHTQDSLQDDTVKKQRLH